MGLDFLGFRCCVENRQKLAADQSMDGVGRAVRAQGGIRMSGPAEFFLPQIADAHASLAVVV